MKRIIDGKAYNTETATLVARREALTRTIRVLEEGETVQLLSHDLYRTREGAFFAADAYEVGFGDFVPLSHKGALKWMEQHDATPEEIERVLGDIPEPGEVSPVYLRLPDVLRQRIVKAAETKGVSLNTWAMRCLETCVSNETENLDLLMAWSIAVTPTTSGCDWAREKCVAALDAVAELIDSWATDKFEEGDRWKDKGVLLAGHLKYDDLMRQFAAYEDGPARRTTRTAKRKRK